MPKYQCPECFTVLKRDDTVEEGKKIKCPKCEVVFEAEAMTERGEKKPEPKKKKKAKAKAEPVKKAGDDEDEGGFYGVREEAEETAEEKDRRKVELGSLRDKFAKSNRGPAMATTVGPSNLLLLQGIVDCLAALALLVIALWPFVFSHDMPKGGRATEKIIMMVVAVFIFAVGCVVCYGASKLQDLGSYKWAMTGCVFGIISVLPTGAIGGVSGIMALKEETVKAGFEETLTTKDY